MCLKSLNKVQETSRGFLGVSEKCFSNIVLGLSNIIIATYHSFTKVNYN